MGLAQIPMKKKMLLERIIKQLEEKERILPNAERRSKLMDHKRNLIKHLNK